MPEVALHIKRNGVILRGVITAEFLRELLEQNFPQVMMENFLLKAQPVEHEVGADAGSLLVDEDAKIIVSSQTAFGLETLEKIYDNWEYREENIFKKLESIRSYHDRKAI